MKSKKRIKVIRKINHHIVGGNGGNGRQGDIFDPNSGAVQAHVALARARLRLPFLPPLNWKASASSAARRVTLADGGPGAVLVQPVGTTMVG